MHLTTPYIDMASLARGKPRKFGERIFKTSKATSIASLTDLRKELGYGHPGQDQDIAFKRAIRHQIEQFKSTEGIPGYRLTKWTDPSHKRGLLEITRDFLDTQGKGVEYWPDRCHLDTSRPLRYHKDSAKIHRLMIKVFWRTAKEYKRHKTSSVATAQLLSQPTNTIDRPIKAQDNSDGTDHRVLHNTPDIRGQTADNPIYLDDMPPFVQGVSETHAPFAGQPMAPFCDERFESNGPENSEHIRAMIGIPFDPNIQNFAPPTQETMATGLDDTLDLLQQDEQRAQNNGKRPAELNDDNTPQPSSSQPQHLPTKRARKRIARLDSAPEEEVAVYDETSSSSMQSSQHSNWSAPNQPTRGSPFKGPLPRHGSRSVGRKTFEPERTPRVEAARRAERDAQATVSAIEECHATTTDTGSADGVQEHTADESQIQPTLPHPEPVGDMALIQEPTPAQEATPVQESGAPGVDLSQAASQNVSDSRRNPRLKLQSKALMASRIELRSSISNCMSLEIWRPSSSIFDMSLEELTAALVPNREFGSLHLLFKSLIPGRQRGLPAPALRNGDSDFRFFKLECLDIIIEEFERSRSLPKAERPELAYSIHISRALDFY
ncbi:hypothetical protein BFJ68_g7100 [Fusarium oxysporum]|uniref:Uncharacterized protein n=3 Tax=Fusarium oxysporum TaxID=5507 RepID=A0A420R8U8_FUSOX|nr:hypothetical protein FOZG_01586 [Fusarium oxysporum Fo47]RKK29182.1 hypothetical protein BFJ65_g1116 [Fusarium oxysporum f. sp. cepae]RKL13433.1 hypothetical protein BFJ68_g7100 [Fusarium oxysporum]